MQFNISPHHEAEQFTETYHLIYEKIQSARVAKRMLDTKNFYGGLLHVCYAPEYETVLETQQKLLQRSKDVLNRLQYLQNEDQKSSSHTLAKNNQGFTDNTASIAESFTMASGPMSYNLEMPHHMIQKSAQICHQSTSSSEIIETKLGSNVIKRKLNMGEINTITIGKQIKDVVFKPKKRKTNQKVQHTVSKNQFSQMVDLNKKMVEKSTNLVKTNLEVIDATSVDSEIVTNINKQMLEHINQKEIVIKKIPQKPVNIIKFNIPNKKL